LHDEGNVHRNRANWIITVVIIWNDYYYRHVKFNWNYVY